MASAKEMAYKRVFGVTDDAILTSPEVVKVLNNATTDVMSYMKLYPGETELQRDRRLEIDSALHGESVELADYFKSVYPDRFRMSTSWDVIFTMYKDINGEASSMTAEETVQAIMSQTVGVQEVAKEVDESHFINTNNNTNIKEDINMSETNSQLTTALDALKNNGALESQGTSTMPKQNDELMNAATDATRKVIKDERDARIAYTRAAKVTKGIAMKPSLKKRVKPGVSAFLVKDGNADTAASKADKAYQKFCAVTGRRVSEAGVVVYDAIRPDCVDDAKKVDSFLVELKNNPLQTLTMQELSDNEQLKGGWLKESEAADEAAKTSKQLLQIMVEKAMGRLNTSVPESQFTIRKAINRVSTTGTQGSKAESGDAKDAWKGVAIVSVIHKADFAAIGYDYAYDMDKAQTEMTSVRIKLPGKVFYKKTDANVTTEGGQEKFVAFTLNGFAEAFATVRNANVPGKDFDMAAKGRGTSGVNDKVLDFNNDEDIAASMTNIEQVLASYLYNNGGNVSANAASVLKNAADIMQKTQAESVQAEADEMAGVQA